MSPRAAVAVLILLLTASSLGAQQTAPATTPTQETPSADRRIFGIGPKFDVSERDNPRALTPNEKFRLFATDATRPYQFLAAAAVTGISMTGHENRGFGQGGEGFAKRFGAAMADEASSAFFGEFLFPTIFHQDPRYFRRGTGTGGQRLGYAISRVVVTRSDTGKSQFNASKIVGTMSSGVLANAYYPDSERSVSRTLTTIGINLGTAAGLNLVKEFWPRGGKRKH
jgi:hypothetical protein